MKKNILFPTVIAAGILASTLAICSSCSQKKHVPKIVGICGTDTLTLVTLKKLSPDTAVDNRRAGHLALEFALSKRNGCGYDTTGEATMAAEGLSRQLSLRSGAEWTSEAATSLLCAARAIKEISETAHTVDNVVRFLDSLFSTTVNLPGSRKTTLRDYLAGCGVSLSAADSLVSKNVLRGLYKNLFDLSDENAQTLLEFVFVQKKEKQDSSALKAMIGGLVFDKHARPARLAGKSSPPAPAEVPDNSELVLKYRNQQSIIDSIKKHYDFLTAIYKKKLKIHQDMAGTVNVQFRINPDGDVISAQITASDIGEKEFLDEYLSYIKTIHFKPVPATVGNMTFQFPFAFTPER